ncbi:MAG: bifunctional phosphopantothenoylcysteine decarboxylase/phosphopantothenate--cysteine ligase CoaBC [Chloroflexi bacterium]|nr:bifunctional phosphopantothenoylcysteine decarboxylase/phosphopantothenate--cysteine ligase CoaBC [Chloroflexota bacterium]
MTDHLLAGKKLLLGITGGIAAYKAADLCSKLVQAGCQVDVVMTDAATKFVGPLTFAALSGRAARVDMWTSPGGEPIPHVQMAAAADLVIVAPLSANTLAKLALGLADNLLTSTLLAAPPAPPIVGGAEGRVRLPQDWGMGGRSVPWVLAPAMESHMWANPITQAHADALRSRGAILVGPGSGRLASGATGVGRMAEPSDILAAARGVFAAAGPLAGCRVVVTAGGTQEPLDPVRFLSNASSGKMGVALAEAARDLGAAVTLIHAPLAVPIPYGVESVPVRTAVEMRDAVLGRLPATDVLIGAAAVADFRPADPASQKIKKTPGQEELTVRLVRNPDILAEVAGRRTETGQPKIVIGFAAETQDLLANAAAKLAAKRLDIIVGNDVTEPGSGFGADDNRVTLLYADGRQEPLPLLAKAEVAERVMAAAVRMLVGVCHSERVGP